MQEAHRGPTDVTTPDRLRRLPSWLVNQVGLRATRLIADHVGRPGARADFAVLAALEQFGGMSQAELGRRLGLDRSDTTAVLNRLEHEGLAVREPDARDRRRNVITMTAAGSASLQDLQHSLDATQAELLAPLTEQERLTLVRLLGRVLGHPAPPGAPEQGVPHDQPRGTRRPPPDPEEPGLSHA
ncbi:MAG: transcriptional regulator, MarR family [Frankiales bacterium]|nr:transcriptional regulator, MarR family [Frankiales bacterium]